MISKYSNEWLLKFKNIKLKNERLLRAIPEEQTDNVNLKNFKSNMNDITEEYENLFGQMLSTMNQLYSRDFIQNQNRINAEKEKRKYELKYSEVSNELQSLDAYIYDMYEIFRCFVYSEKNDDIGNPKGENHQKVKALKNYFTIKLNKYKITNNSETQSNDIININNIKNNNHFDNSGIKDLNITKNGDSRFNSVLNMSKQELSKLNCSNYKNNMKFLNTRTNIKDDPENSVFFDMIANKNRNDILDNLNTNDQINSIIQDKDFNVLNSIRQNEMGNNKFGSLNTESNFGGPQNMSVNFNEVNQSDMNIIGISNIRNTEHESGKGNDSELQTVKDQIEGIENQSQKNFSSVNVSNKSSNSINQFNEFDNMNTNVDEDDEESLLDGSIVRVKTIERLEDINKINSEKSEMKLKQIQETSNKDIEYDDDDQKVNMSDTFNMTLDFGKQTNDKLKTNKFVVSKVVQQTFDERVEDKDNNIDDDIKQDKNEIFTENNQDSNISNEQKQKIGSSFLTQTMTIDLNKTNDNKNETMMSGLTKQIMNNKLMSGINFADESFNVNNDINYNLDDRYKSDSSLKKIEEALKEKSYREVDNPLQANSQFVKIGDEMIKTNQPIQIREIIEAEEIIIKPKTLDNENDELNASKNSLASKDEDTEEKLNNILKKDKIKLNENENNTNTNSNSNKNISVSTRNYMQNLSLFNDQFKKEKEKELEIIDDEPIVSTKNIKSKFEQEIMKSVDIFMTNEKVNYKSLPSKKEIDLLIIKDKKRKLSENSFEEHEKVLNNFTKGKNEEIDIWDSSEPVDINKENGNDLIDVQEDTIIHNNTSKIGKKVDILRKMPKKSVSKLRNRGSKDHSTFISKKEESNEKKNNLIFQKLYSKKALTKKNKMIPATKTPSERGKSLMNVSSNKINKKEDEMKNKYITELKNKNEEIDYKKQFSTHSNANNQEKMKKNNSFMISRNNGPTKGLKNKNLSFIKKSSKASLNDLARNKKINLSKTNDSFLNNSFKKQQKQKNVIDNFLYNGKNKKISKNSIEVEKIFNSYNKNKQKFDSNLLYPKN